MPAFIKNLAEGGQATTNGPDRSTTWSTATCQHCGFIEDIPPGKYPEDAMGRCFYCWSTAKPLSGLICQRCVRKGVCSRVADEIERAINKQRTVAGYFECK